MTSLAPFCGWDKSEKTGKRRIPKSDVENEKGIGGLTKVTQLMMMKKVNEKMNKGRRKEERR